MITGATTQADAKKAKAADLAVKEASAVTAQVAIGGGRATALDMASAAKGIRAVRMGLVIGVTGPRSTVIVPVVTGPLQS